MGAYSNEAERVTGRLQAMLDFEAIDASIQSSYFPRVPVG
jgi:hypothetical protein